MTNPSFITYSRLTSWVLWALKDASQAEWEEYNLYIDPLVREASAKWVISHQTIDGSWAEHSSVQDREKFQVMTFPNTFNRFVNK